MLRILVVDDDAELNGSVCRFLEMNGYEAVGCLGANDAYNAMYGELFDLIISDIMMPGIDGFEFAETVRGLDREIPFLFMTAKDDLGSKQRGYRIGIDDYLVKPVDLEELILKIGALLRRAKINSSRKIELGKFSMNADERTAVLDGEEIPLTVREFNLLYKLLSYPGKIFTRIQLMDEIWGSESETGWETVTVHIGRLRKRFEGWDEFEIVSVRGLGYKAEKKVSAAHE